MTAKPLNILVVGAGMYVCGSGTEGFGTILPTLVQEQHRGKLGEIHMTATRPKSIALLLEKLDQLNRRMNTKGHIHVYPSPGDDTRDEEAYKKALEAIPRPAAAIISVPDHLHASITEHVIRAGIHPLVVKPLTPTVKEAKQLIRLLNDQRLYGAVEFHKRFDTANLMLRQKVEDSLLGDICYIVVEFSQRRMVRQIFKSWVARTNIFQYLGVHYADMVYFVTGARPLRVMAIGQVYSESSPQSYDAIQAVVEWQMESTQKRFVSTIITNWIDPDTTSAMSDQKIMVVGTKGRFQSDQKNRGVQMVTEEGGIEDINPYFTQLYRNNENRLNVHGYGPHSIQQFLTDVKNLEAGKINLEELETLRPSFQQALPSTAVLEAVNISLAQNSQWIDVDLKG
jgi:predicted dehydrogenase